MWNPVSGVANSRFMPQKELMAFAIANEAKYGIEIVTPTHVLVNTWHCNDMVEDFRAQNSELCERVRAEKVEALKRANQKG